MPLRGQRRALERVDGDVDLRRRAVADLLAVVEHRRLVLLALADDDDAVHRDGVEHEAHRVDGGLVGGVLVAAADQRAAASAAASVTRTSSSARLRSGLESGMGPPVEELRGGADPTAGAPSRGASRSGYVEAASASRSSIAHGPCAVIRSARPSRSHDSSRTGRSDCWASVSGCSRRRAASRRP